VNDLWAAFRVFDKDGDGSISFEELKEVVQKIRVGVTDLEVFEMMNEADTNKDGQIDFKEFITLMAKQIEVIHGIGAKLLSKSSSIRRIFKTMDSNYYGYLSTAQFRAALDNPDFGLTDLSTREKDLVVAYCDGADKSDGKIDYREFFITFFKFHVKQRLKLAEKSSLKQVFVITRHGTRFPLTPMPTNNSWPNHPEFWKSYGGKLTPKGIKQHTKLGKRLADHYMPKLGLIPDDEDFPNNVYVFTSNTDRTLLSASGFLTGFCPSVSHTFAVEGDEVDLKYQGVKIHVADPSRKNTPVVHGYIGHNKYIVGKDKAGKDCAFFKTIEKEPKYAELFEKLWKMTKHERIDPSKPLIQRFAHMSPVHQQIEIERSLKMNVLSNKAGIGLTAHDEELMEAIADAGKRAKFQGNTMEEHRELARAAAGLLPSHIVKSFKERIETIVNPTSTASKKKFVLYSAHDYTMMAVLSQLGFREWPIPKFASHLLFELHRIDKEFFIKVGYCPNPSRIANVSDYKFVTLPRDVFIPWSDAKNESQSFKEFEDILMNVRKSFTSEAEWKADGDTVQLPPGKSAGGDD
jgi:calmodulin